MSFRLFLAFAALLSLGGCGVKSSLDKPADPPQKGEKNPSQPPSPIGR